LARTAVVGNLKVMLPMVTTPGELAQAREHLDAVMAELGSEGLPARSRAWNHG
jgi:phosphotransferase system enzyme I (PtsI)